MLLPDVLKIHWNIVELTLFVGPTLINGIRNDTDLDKIKSNKECKELLNKNVRKYVCDMDRYGPFGTYKNIIKGPLGQYVCKGVFALR